MTELKAYACLETGEYMGAVIFAKSNIEARRLSANEFNEGEIGGMQVKRAPWADKYGSRSKIPISVMVDHGWHFECCWSGVTIDSDLYQDGHSYYDHITKEYIWDENLIGKEPVGFQDGICFACEEYAEKHWEAKRIEKEFDDEEIKYYRSIVIKNFPDAELLNDEGYMRREWISSRDMETSNFLGFGPRYVHEVHIPFSFPGMEHWAALEFRQPSSYYGMHMGPLKPFFICANGDKEKFEKWTREQKEKYKNV